MLSDHPWASCWELDPHTTYLNHGSFGPSPLLVQQARVAAKVAQLEAAVRISKQSKGAKKAPTQKSKTTNKKSANKSKKQAKKAKKQAKKAKSG